jgi:hypothetical protein
LIIFSEIKDFKRPCVAVEIKGESAQGLGTFLCSVVPISQFVSAQYFSGLLPTLLVGGGSNLWSFSGGHRVAASRRFPRNSENFFRLPRCHHARLAEADHSSG